MMQNTEANAGQLPQADAYTAGNDNGIQVVNLLDWLLTEDNAPR